MPKKTEDKVAKKLGEELDNLIESFVSEHDVTYDTVMGVLFHRAVLWSAKAQND